MFFSNATQALFYMPDNRSALIKCSSTSCSVDDTGNDDGGDGSGFARLDINASDFDGDFSKAHNVIPITDARGVKYIFKSQIINDNAEGQIVRIEYPGGYTINYENEFFSDIVVANGSERRLTRPRYLVKKMTDTFGRTISFTYGNRAWAGAEAYVGGQVVARPSTTGNIERIDLPDGGWLDFRYDSATPLGLKYGLDERLKTVERFDAAENSIDVETYLYEDQIYPFALTGIVDAAGINYASWTYSDIGLANSSELNGGLNKYTLDYQIDFNRGFSADRVTVTNPLERVTHYDTRSFGRYIDKITGDASENVPADFARSSSAGTTDREGNITSYTRNSKGWPEKMVQASGSSVSTTTDIVWHDEYRLPLQRVEAGLTTDFTYDDAGRMLSMTQTDTTSAASTPRTWAFTHFGPNVSSVDGPLPGSSDTQFFNYGGPNLIGLTNELGHQTSITSHNEIGAPQSLIDPNGNVTRLIYDSKHRLIAIIEDDGGRNATTELSYNPNDLLTSVMQPNGSALNFGYDGARRLMSITNSVGDRIDYIRNNMGGILSTKISGAENNGIIQFEITQVTDEINRVIKTATVGGAIGLPAETTLGYDKADNLTSIIDPRQNSWQQSYDGLNRLVKEIDPVGGETSYSLSRQSDARNPLSSVTDPRSVTTNYVRNGFGEVIREVSLEAGITEYIRDERGLVTQMTDARGVMTNYTYDIAGRLLTETYPSEASSDITYTYDEGPNGIGELTTVTEGFGATSYAYDSLGHMTSMTRSINGQSYTTAYTYDLAGEVLTETYPSGRTVRMIRDGAARITAIEAKGPGETEFAPLLSNITYAAFGPMTGADFADGHSLDISYDSAYRAKSLRRTTQTSSLMDITFEHDASGNILAMNDNVRPERSQSFTYDALSRLTSALNMGQTAEMSGYGVIGYEYNAGGDRTARNYTPIGEAEQNSVYNYDATTARLTDITQAGSTLRLFGYDASGQVISDTRSDDVITSIFDYGLNARGRMVSVSEDGALAASYTYDMSEQRIVKAVSGEAAIHYHYDGEGRLIAETDAASGTTLREYIWLGLTPIASYGSSYDPEDPVNDNCNPVFREDLAERLLDRQDRLALVQERIGVVSGYRDDRTARQATVAARKAELEATLAGVPDTNVIRIDALTGRIADLEVRLTTLAAAIETLGTRIEDLAGEKVANKPNILLRGLDRFPDYLKGGVGVPLLGQIRSNTENCTCQP